MGLQMEDRSPYQQKAYKGYFATPDVSVLEQSEQSPTLLRLVEVSLFDFLVPLLSCSKFIDCVVSEMARENPRTSWWRLLL